MQKRLPAALVLLVVFGTALRISAQTVTLRRRTNNQTVTRAIEGFEEQVVVSDTTATDDRRPQCDEHDTRGTPLPPTRRRSRTASSISGCSPLFSSPAIIVQDAFSRGGAGANSQTHRRTSTSPTIRRRSGGAMAR